MLTANYYPGDQNNHAAVDIIRLVPMCGHVEAIRGARREHVETIEVSGKRDARAIAAKMGARPWNF